VSTKQLFFLRKNERPSGKEVEFRQQIDTVKGLIDIVMFQKDVDDLEVDNESTFSRVSIFRIFMPGVD
jgi:hypothetical protein